MRRRVLNMISVSLLLSVAAAALWILSDVMPFQWEWTTTKGREDPAWSRGQLCVGQGRIGYVLWMPEPGAWLRYGSSYHRFQRMTPNEFSYDHMFRFDPWTTGRLSEPVPTDAKDFWWWGIQHSRFSGQLTGITMRQIWLPFWLITACLMIPCFGRHYGSANGPARAIACEQAVAPAAATISPAIPAASAPNAECKFKQFQIEPRARDNC